MNTYSLFSVKYLLDMTVGIPGRYPTISADILRHPAISSAVSRVAIAPAEPCLQNTSESLSFIGDIEAGDFILWGSRGNRCVDTTPQVYEALQVRLGSSLEFRGREGKVRRENKQGGGGSRGVRIGGY
jgi:hypothetical protein